MRLTETSKVLSNNNGKTPLSHKMVVMEEDGKVWYELIWEERPIIPDEE